MYIGFRYYIGKYICVYRCRIHEYLFEVLQPSDSYVSGLKYLDFA